MRHRAHGLGLLELLEEGVHLEVGLHGLVGHLLDLAELLGAQRALPVEVEPQITWPVQRSGLNGAGTQHLSQRGVHHMGAGVALGGALAPVGIDRRQHGVSFDEFPGFHVDAVYPKGFRDLLHVGDGGPGGFTRPGAADGAGVGNLTTGLGIERSAVQHEFDAVGARRLLSPVGDHRHPFAVDEDA